MQILKVQNCLYLTYFLLAVFMSSASIIILQLIVNYGFEKDVAGELTIVRSIFLLIPSFASAYILKLGYKKSMLLGLILLVSSGLIVAVVPNIWAIVILFAISGFSHTIIKLSVYSTIGLISLTQQKHTDLMSRVEGAYIIGSLSGPLLFSWMIKWYSWNDTYWIIAVFLVLNCAMLLNSNFHENVAITESQKPSFSQMLMLLNYPFVWVSLICALLYGMIELGFKTWLPTFNTEVFKLSSAQSVLFLSIYAGAIAISRFLFSYLHKRFSWLSIQISYLASAFIFTLAVLTLTSSNQLDFQNTWYVIFLATIFSIVGFFFGPIYPTICSIVLSHLQKAHQSAMSGLLIIFTEFGINIGVLAIGYFSTQFSIHSSFYIMLIPMGLLAISLVFYNQLSHRFNDSYSSIK